MQKKYTRRDFIEFMGGSALAFSFAGGAAGLLQACTSAPKTKRILEGKSYFALDPSAGDRFALAEGLSYQVLLRWQDSLNSKGLQFGNNSDYLAHFPLGDKNEALLCVNHESPGYLFVSDWNPGDKTKTRAQIEIERANVGVSIVHLRDNRLVFNSPYNRRIDGRTPIRMVSERPILKGKQAIGTLGNCAGGFTPWGTYLTCEENYHDFYGENVHSDNGKITRKPSKNFNWELEFPEPPEHYGWVVEINPQTGEAKKLAALGRFAHECATVRKGNDGRCVVYSGDDAAGEHLYKFIAEKAGSLETGLLYVANLEQGRWLPLLREENLALAKKFKDHTELLIRAREASKIVGATPT